jgi:nitrous oxidase accessory protein NosD
VTMRSESGDPGSVTIDGEYQTGEIVAISANDVTIAEVTLTKAYYHPIHVTGRDNASISGTNIYRVRIVDPAEQAIKINSSGAGYYVDYGKVECCHIELTDAGRTHIRNNCYTGGVDAHEAWGWEIRDNLIKGFWCDTGLSEHGIHMWQCCRDTLVERNTIVDCARGIGFGMGDSGVERDYPDNPYPGVGYIGHYDGIIRNNFIFATIPGFDSGILLEQARGSQVVHNTVVSLQQPFNCIEWRWDNTDVKIKNNLLSHNLMDRGGTAELGGNVENAPGSVFENRNAGELHLVSGAAGCIDQGVPLPGGLCDEDIDGDNRDGNPDVGADEYVE